MELLPMRPRVPFCLLILLLTGPELTGCNNHNQGPTHADSATPKVAQAATAEPVKEIAAPTDQALKLVERLKGSFEIDEQSPGRPVVRIDLSFTTATDADLARLTGCTRLQELYLIDTKITNAGLEHLRAYSSLRTLDLARSAVTDRGLVQLQGLIGLQRSVSVARRSRTQG
jgi:hypothetical protein